jgi:23S rRNA pseudouridine2605 synthase
MKPVSRTGLARALSKLGFCSRSEAWRLIQAGKVRLDGRPVFDPETPTFPGRSRIEVEGVAVAARSGVYLVLNKPRGLVTTASDERGRDTVFQCLEGADLPRVFPVGRLDQASEGLLLFTNDTAWAARIADPATHLDKTYHVQIDRLADEAFCRTLETGVVHDGERLTAKRVSVLRSGEKNCWLEIVLDEGRNRHIRRLLEAHGAAVLHLVRIAIGGLRLGGLAKGSWRMLTTAEVRALAVGAPKRSPGEALEKSGKHETGKRAAIGKTPRTFRASPAASLPLAARGEAPGELP